MLRPYLSFSILRLYRFIHYLLLTRFHYNNILIFLDWLILIFGKRFNRLLFRKLLRLPHRGLHRPFLVWSWLLWLRVIMSYIVVRIVVVHSCFKSLCWQPLRNIRPPWGQHLPPAHRACSYYLRPVYSGITDVTLGVIILFFNRLCLFVNNLSIFVLSDSF